MFNKHRITALMRAVGECKRERKKDDVCKVHHVTCICVNHIKNYVLLCPYTHSKREWERENNTNNNHMWWDSFLFFLSDVARIRDVQASGSEWVRERECIKRDSYVHMKYNSNSYWCFYTFFQEHIQLWHTKQGARSI